MREAYENTAQYSHGKPVAMCLGFQSDFAVACPESSYELSHLSVQF